MAPLSRQKRRLISAVELARSPAETDPGTYDCHFWKVTLKKDLFKTSN
jgi:hypothetical protein